LRDETEQRQIKLQQLNTNTVYDAYCQDIISEINRLIKKAKHAQYNDDGNTVKECLSQFDKLTDSLPETAQVRQQRAEQLAVELADKQDKIALNFRQLIELIENLNLPDSIQGDYEYELQHLENRMDNLSRANPDEETLKQAEGLESDIAVRMKRLPI
jgi:hypothetical protein